MTMIFLIATLVIVYISITVIVMKDIEIKGMALIPGVNIYNFLKMLGLSNLDMLILLVGIIIPITRPFMLPFAYILISFMVSYAMEKGFLFGLLFLIVPFISYPVLAASR